LKGVLLFYQFSIDLPTRFYFHENRGKNSALEEDLSDEEADSAGPVEWVVPAWEVLAADPEGGGG
jgi:hypothetical protein